MDVHSPAHSLDYLDGRILIGHLSGRIATVDVDGHNWAVQGVSHHAGEVWGLELVPEQGTFLTCGDDNEFLEISIENRAVLRSGKIWSEKINGLNREQGDSKKAKYQTSKIKCTASSQSNLPPY